MLSLQNPIRKFAVRAIKHKFFDKTILCFILGNCIFLAMSSNEPNFESTGAGKAVAFSENIFTAAFCLELVLKVGRCRLKPC